MYFGQLIFEGKMKNIGDQSKNIKLSIVVSSRDYQYSHPFGYQYVSYGVIPYIIAMII